MYYTVYKTTNQVNGKFYIGTHKTVDLNDNYMGSGSLLKRAIEKYGIENFKKEILFVFDNSEDMFAKEAEIVTEDFLVEENTYNLKIGGFGGFDYLNLKFDNQAHKKQHISKMNDIRKLKYPNGTFYGKNVTEKTKEKISKSKLGNSYFKGKKHKSSTIEKMKRSAVGKHIGEKNSQFGTEWITNGLVNIKIKKGSQYTEGFRKGRV